MSDDWRAGYAAGTAGALCLAVRYVEPNKFYPSADDLPEEAAGRVKAGKIIRELLNQSLKSNPRT